MMMTGRRRSLPLRGLEGGDGLHVAASRRARPWRSGRGAKGEMGVDTVRKAWSLVGENSDGDARGVAVEGVDEAGDDDLVRGKEGLAVTIGAEMRRSGTRRRARRRGGSGKGWLRSSEEAQLGVGVAGRGGSDSGETHGNGLSARVGVERIELRAKRCE